MMMLLLMAGIGALLGGVVAILFGIPVKEFSFGNTLIVVGAMAACTGLIMIALSVVVGELKLIARRLGSRVAADAQQRPALAPDLPDAADDDFLFPRDQPVLEDNLELAMPPVSPPVRNGTNAARARQNSPSESEACRTRAQAEAQSDVRVGFAKRTRADTSEAPGYPGACGAGPAADG